MWKIWKYFKIIRSFSNKKESDWALSSFQIAHGVYVFGSGDQPSLIKSDWGELWPLTRNNSNLHCFSTRSRVEQFSL